MVDKEGGPDMEMSVNVWIIAQQWSIMGAKWYLSAFSRHDNKLIMHNEKGYLNIWRVEKSLSTTSSNGAS